MTRTEIPEHVYLAFDEAPVSRAELLEMAASSGHGPRPAVLQVLRGLPDVTFGQLRDLWEHLPDVPVTAPR